jgi:hypothetical protein
MYAEVLANDHFAEADQIRATRVHCEDSTKFSKAGLCDLVPTLSGGKPREGLALVRQKRLN